ncbi:MAG: hypothetical protein GXP51_03535 [Deltaproteobacteria bacterium]|nr:hypothetical protein [Deltaproteobacteria bacterium]
MLKSLVLMLTLNGGATLGWYAGSPGGIMGSYFAAVIGAALGLYLGRKIQRSISSD